MPSTSCAFGALRRQFVGECQIVDPAASFGEDYGALKALDRLRRITTDARALGFNQSDPMGEILRTVLGHVAKRGEASFGVGLVGLALSTG